VVVVSGFGFGGADLCFVFVFVFSTATVTAQTDEIEFLRQELDRLRQRTFPSFASRRDHVGDAY
jgi:hypothetical protein